MTNGPGGTLVLETRWLLTNTSTVEGTTAVPPVVKSGVVRRSGRMPKLVAKRTPPKRTALPQLPGSEIVSPRFTVSSRETKSCVNSVSRRTAWSLPSPWRATPEEVSTPFLLKTPSSRSSPAFRVPAIVWSESW